METCSTLVFAVTTAGKDCRYSTGCGIKLLSEIVDKQAGMLAYLKFKAQLGSSMQQMRRLLQLNLFARRDLITLFKPPSIQLAVSPQILLWDNL